MAVYFWSGKVKTMVLRLFILYPPNLKVHDPGNKGLTVSNRNGVIFFVTKATRLWKVASGWR